jgi:hypothetical protein
MHFRRRSEPSVTWSGEEASCHTPDPGSDSGTVRPSGVESSVQAATGGWESPGLRCRPAARAVDPRSPSCWPSAADWTSTLGRLPAAALDRRRPGRRVDLRPPAAAPAARQRPEDGLRVPGPTVGPREAASVTIRPVTPSRIMAAAPTNGGQPDRGLRCERTTRNTGKRLVGWRSGW